MERLTQARALEVLSYDRETGEIRWRVTRGHHRKAGTEAGTTKCGHGYRAIGVDGRVYMAHRLAWLIEHGHFPARELDHINGNKMDNRIANLREANRAQQTQNVAKARNNTSGVPGVSLHSCGRWQAHIGYGGKSHYLGLYPTIDAAAEARAQAKAQLHSFQPVQRT